VEIEYCTQCRFILRAGWLAQELLMTFGDELGELALVPGAGGVFEVRLNGASIFSRKKARVVSRIQGAQADDPRSRGTPDEPRPQRRSLAPPGPSPAERRHAMILFRFPDAGS
jgi:selenoprotein W-related protein